MTDLSIAEYDYENGDVIVALDKEEFGEEVNRPTEFLNKGVPNGLRVLDNDIDDEKCIEVKQLFDGASDDTEHEYHVKNLDRMINKEILDFEENVDDEANPLA